jgi:hypothetical protein
MGTFNSASADRVSRPSFKVRTAHHAAERPVRSLNLSCEAVHVHLRNRHRDHLSVQDTRSNWCYSGSNWFHWIYLKISMAIPESLNLPKPPNKSAWPYRNVFDVFVATNIQTRIVPVDPCSSITCSLAQPGWMHASISPSSRSSGDSDKPLPCAKCLWLSRQESHVGRTPLIGMAITALLSY